jgi:hypothetical protein
MARETIPKLKFKKLLIEQMGRPEWDRKVGLGWEIQPCHEPCDFDGCQGWVFEPSSLFPLRHGGSESRPSGYVMTGTVDDSAFPVATVPVEQPVKVPALPFIACSNCEGRFILPAGGGILRHECQGLCTVWSWSG